MGGLSDQLTDMCNIGRAKDATISLALADLNRAARPPPIEFSEARMQMRRAALLNRFWRFNCGARAIDHLLYESNGGFWRWVTGGRGNVLSIGVVVIASTWPPPNRLLGLGQP